MFKALNQYIQTSNKVREPGRQLEAMDWRYSTPVQTHANIHLLWGLSRAGTSCQREWKQLRLGSPSREGSEGNQSDNLVLAIQSVKELSLKSWTIFML